MNAFTAPSNPGVSLPPRTRLAAIGRRATWVMGAVLASAAATPNAPAGVTVAPPPPAPGPAATAHPAAPAGSAMELAQSLGRIVGRLSQKEALSAVDVSEFAHETLNWGRRVRDSHAPVPPGPVRDALAGLDQLEARGNTLADWGQLRKDLEALLQKPPDSKQKEQQPQQQQQQQQKKSDSPPKQDSSSQPQKQDQQQQPGQKNDESSSQPDQKPPQGQKSDQPPSNQSAFGDMAKPPPPPPPSSGETQKVGGAREKPAPEEQKDPSLTLPLEKLDQLKNQDSPSQLFQKMQTDRSQASRKTPQKDW